MIIVEDDGATWLPDSAGCKSIREMLDTAPEVILHITLFNFKTPAGLTPLTTSSSQNTQIMANQQTKNRYTGEANVQSISFLSDPQNPLCCDDTAVASGEGDLLSGTNSNADLMIVNGAWQPTIPMTSGVHQRWRMIHTGYKKFTDLQIVDAATMKATTSCELQLIAKDGLYLMQIPRKVDHVFLTSGNRAELLVKCTGTIGQKFIITSGNSLVTPFFDNPTMGGGGMGGGGGGPGMGGGGPGMGGGGGGMGSSELAHNQAIVAYIEITKASVS